AGSVHTIPFSSVTTVKNMTKDFAYASFSISVSYGSDVDEVVQAMRDVVAGMRESDEFRYSMLEDLQVMGLDKFSEAGLVVLARVKTPAGKQWGVAREFNRRLKTLFDARGIEMPYPQST